MVTQLAASSARILLVDDSEDEVRLIARILATGGYVNVEWVTDPVAAVERARQSPPDLLVVDLHMPRLGGLDVIARLNDTSFADPTPVLMLTGETRLDARVEALERGARDFLSKPVDRGELLARVRNLVDARLRAVTASARTRALESSVSEMARDLRGASLETVRRLAMAAEWRDDQTGAHLSRVGRYCEVLARVAGLDPHDSARLAAGAPLHDIGKIALPDAILRKAGPLTEAERTLMQTHTTMGAAILGDSRILELQTAERIALTHHERWDGTGYPAGLRGLDIPIEGRICAIADVFDALTTSRPYKRAWPLEDAVEEIQRQRGRQFDPHLADLFVSQQPVIRQIHHSVTD